MLSAKNVGLDTLDWRVPTHMAVDSASAMDIPMCVIKLKVTLEETFQMTLPEVLMVGLSSMSKVPKFGN